MKKEHRGMINTLARGVEDWMTREQVTLLASDLAKAITRAGTITTTDQVLKELERQVGIRKEREALLPTRPANLRIRLMRHLVRVGLSAISELRGTSSPFHPTAVPFIQAYLARHRRWIIHIPSPAPPHAPLLGKLPVRMAR